MISRCIWDPSLIASSVSIASFHPIENSIGPSTCSSGLHVVHGIHTISSPCIEKPKYFLVRGCITDVLAQCGHEAPGEDICCRIRVVYDRNYRIPPRKAVSPGISRASHMSLFSLSWIEVMDAQEDPRARAQRYPKLKAFKSKS